MNTSSSRTAPASAAAESAVTLDISQVDLNGPAIADVVVTVTNGDRRPINNVEVGFRGPIGWTVYPERQQIRHAVGAGKSADVHVQLRIPNPRSGFRIRTFTATADFRGSGGQESTATTMTQRTGDPLADLAAAFNNVGVTDESNPTPGDYDGDGNSFSAQKLADQGLTPGAAVEALGAQLTWPAADPGTPGNVSASGQAITLGGSGSKVVFLGSGVGNSATGSATVYYTDGSSSSGAIGFPNWSVQEPDAHGATLIASSIGRNTPKGYANANYEYRIFAHSVELDADKTVDFVVLPSSAGLHIFAMAIA